MIRVLKYPMPEVGEMYRVNAPHAKFRHFADQDGVLTAWFEVDDEYGSIERKYQIFATGQAIPEHSRWLGSCQSGPCVWHLFQMF